MVFHISFTKFTTRTISDPAKEPYNKNVVRVTAQFRWELLLEVTYFQQLTNQRYTA